jgi:sirohydrochlorin cobaltochelatase
VSHVTAALARWLDAGAHQIGEVIILGWPSGALEIRHTADAGFSRAGLTPLDGVPALRELTLYDAAGCYRPLKTAPTLRRGWRLALSSIGQLHKALDAIYPAMLASRLAFDEGRLAVTHLRGTLSRQSGMYSITRRITDAQADAMVADYCRGCLKHILWQLEPGRPFSTIRPFATLPPEETEPAGTPDTIPLLCAEACNLLVARAREIVKERK